MVKSNSKKWFFIFFIVSVFVLIYMQFITPYYFLRNDNLYQFFGPLTNALETTLHGKIPWINHFQNMGVPLFEMGYFPVFYPLLLLSYLISKLFGNMYLIFEIFSIIHILCSFGLTYFLFKKHNKNDFFSSLGAFSFVFSGYLMIKLHDWFYLAPSMIFLPLIFLVGSFKKNKMNLFLLGIIRGIYFYTGNIQFVIYCLFFELCFYVLNYIKTRRKKYLFFYLKSLIFTVIIALPNLILMLLMSLDSSRVASLGGYFLSHFVNPFYFLIGSIIPSFLTKTISQFTAFYYVNIFIFLGFTLYLFNQFKKYKFRLLVKDPFLTLTLLSILLSFGIIGVLYGFFAIVPVWNNFIHPQKIMFFTSFFICFIGTKYLSKKIKNKRLFFIIGLISVLFVFFQIPIYSNHTSFFRNDFPLELDLPVSNEGRVLSMSNNSENYDVNFLGQNYASLFNLYHVSGYEHLMPKINRHVVPIDRLGNFIYGEYEFDINILKDYGVRYVISDYVINELSNYTLYNKFYLYEIKDFKPLIFVNNSQQKLNWTQNNNDIYFSTDLDKTETIIFNNLYLENYKIYLDDNLIDKNQDAYGRIYFDVPSGKHSVKITYGQRFFISLVLFCSFVLVILFIFWKKINYVLNYIFNILIILCGKLFSRILKYWFVFLILFILIYSMVMLRTLHNQGFIKPLVNCIKKNPTLSCVSTEYNIQKTARMCEFLKNNNIPYIIGKSIEDYCAS